MKRREILKSAGCVLFLPPLESFGQDRSAPEQTEAKAGQHHLSGTLPLTLKLFDSNNST